MTMGRRERQKRRVRGEGQADGAAASGRYTPPRSSTVRIRGTRDKVIGIVLLVIGVAIVVVNYVDYDGMHLLPGGHQEYYFFLGLAIAATSMWWFGAFDRSPSADEIRRQYSQRR